MKVVLAVATSLDGKISTATRGPVTFTSRADRARLHALRDGADALLLGAATLRAEDPPLLPDTARQAARLKAGRRPSPLRAVVTSSLDLPLGRALVARPDAPVVLYTPRCAPADRCEEARARGWEVVHVGDERVDLRAALDHLREAHGVRDVLCEGGGILNAGLLEDDLLDEIHLTLCPVILGGENAPTPVDGAGFVGEAVRQARLLDCQVVDQEVFLVYGLRSTL